MGRPRLAVVDRIRERATTNPETGCWEWQGAKEKGGYGIIKVTKQPGTHRREMVHRAAYEELVGPIPEGLTLDHLCRNRACCNPAHLEPVTGHENMVRGRAPDTIFRDGTHCIHGHEFTPENTYIDKRGRYCRECRRRRNAESDARKKARRGEA